MESILLVVPGAVLSLVYLLHPLVSKNFDAPWARFEFLRGDDETTETGSDETAERAPGAKLKGPNGQRAMTDGGRVCHSCGAHVEGEYLYCAECLTPRV